VYRRYTYTHNGSRTPHVLLYSRGKEAKFRFLFS